MKRFLLIAIASLFLIPTQGTAQKWLKKLENVVKEVDKLTSTNSSTNTTNTEKTNSTSEEVQGGMKITSCHPDIKVKVTRCEAANKTCIIDLLITNVNENDISSFVFAGGLLSGGFFPPISIAYDDEGNQITNDKFLTGIAGKTVETGGSTTALPSNIPVKLRIQLEGIPESAKILARVDLRCLCKQIGISLDKPIILKNIPISRDGDE